MVKEFIGDEEFSLDSFRLGRLIYNSEYIPTKIIGLWRWGAEVSFRIDEYYRFKGIKILSYPLKTEHYDKENALDDVELFGMESLKKVISKEDKILIVDEVFDTGKSIDRVVKELEKISKEIKVATLYYKPEKRKVKIVPNYYLHKKEADKWLVWPGEFENLTLEEIKIKSQKLYEILTT